MISVEDFGVVESHRATYLVPPVNFFEKYVKMVSLNKKRKTDRAVSKDTKINKIRLDWTEILTPEA